MVNNNDIVPRVPPRWLGYRHMGQEIYLNRHGKISNLRSWFRVRDRLQGLLASLRLWKIDYFSDHSMVEYIKHIRFYYEQNWSVHAYAHQNTFLRLIRPVGSNRCWQNHGTHDSNRLRSWLISATDAFFNVPIVSVQ